MKKKILILLLFCSTYLNSQNFSRSITKNIGIFNTTAGVTYSLNRDYLIEGRKGENGYFEITLKSDNNKSKTFLLKPLAIDFFESKFKRHFKSLAEEAEGQTFISIAFESDKISSLFARLSTFERTEEDRPIVANITLKKQIPIIIWKDKNTKIAKKVDDVKLELTFFEGFIEKIELELEIYGEIVRFTNTYSVGISSSNGIKKLDKHHLLSFKRFKYKSGVTPKLERSNENSAFRLEINLADIIDYDREVDINGNDISPKPTKLLLDQTQSKSKLYREESTKLIEAVVYSDINGIRNNDNPNGIIQTELAKKFYINTNRKQFKTSDTWFLPPFIPFWFSEAIGGFEYLKLSAVFSKIENQNKNLLPTTFDGKTFFESIKVMQHQAFSIGADLNLMYFENQNKKINTYLDFGLHYGLSNLQTSTSNSKSINTISPAIEMGFHFISENRYGFIASNRISYLSYLNIDDLEFNSITNKAVVNANQSFNKTELEFFLNISATGKLFARYNLVSELNDWDNNFSQFQIGYSFYFLKENGKSK